MHSYLHKNFILAKRGCYTDEAVTEAWEHYHGLMTDLPTTGIEDWEFTQGFYCVLSQEAKEHIDTLTGGTFFTLNTEEV
jgi:hypothetical protein